MMTTIAILNNSPDLPLFIRNSNPSISTATDLTKSDTRPASGEVQVKLSRKIKKSTTKSAFSHFKEEDVAEKRRSTTVSEAKVSASEADDDEVNVKADR